MSFLKRAVLEMDGVERGTMNELTNSGLSPTEQSVIQVLRSDVEINEKIATIRDLLKAEERVKAGGSDAVSESFDSLRASCPAEPRGGFYPSVPRAIRSCRRTASRQTFMESESYDELKKQSAAMK